MAAYLTVEGEQEDSFATKKTDDSFQEQSFFLVAEGSYCSLDSLGATVTSQLMQQLE